MLQNVHLHLLRQKPFKCSDDRHPFAAKEKKRNPANIYPYNGMAWVVENRSSLAVVDEAKGRRNQSAEVEG